MMAVDYLPLAIELAELDSETGTAWTIQTQRFSGDSVEIDRIEKSAGPSVLWRMSEQQTTAGLDGPQYPYVQWFEIECRAPTSKGAYNMADDILQRFTTDGALLDIVSRFDEPDDPSQKAGHYYAHIIEVSLPQDGCPDIERE